MWTIVCSWNEFLMWILIKFHIATNSFLFVVYITHTESSDSTVFDFSHCKCTELGLTLKLSYKCCWNWMEAPNLFYWLLHQNFLSMQRIDRSLKFNYVKNWHIGVWVPLHTLHTWQDRVGEWGDSPWFSVASLSLLPPWFTTFIIKKCNCAGNHCFMYWS